MSRRTLQWASFFVLAAMTGCATTGPPPRLISDIPDIEAVRPNFGRGGTVVTLSFFQKESWVREAPQWRVRIHREVAGLPPETTPPAPPDQSATSDQCPAILARLALLESLPPARFKLSPKVLMLDGVAVYSITGPGEGRSQLRRVDDPDTPVAVWVEQTITALAPCFKS